MKTILLIISMGLSLNLSVFAQSPIPEDLDLDLDQTLDQIDRFLDTFDMSEITTMLMNPEIMLSLPDDVQMDQLKEEMKLGIDNMRNLDLSMMQEFMKGFQNFMPQFQEMMPQIEQMLPQFEQVLPNPAIPNNGSEPVRPQKPDAPIKKI